MVKWSPPTGRICCYLLQQLLKRKRIRALTSERNTPLELSRSKLLTVWCFAVLHLACSDQRTICSTMVAWKGKIRPTDLLLQLLSPSCVWKVSEPNSTSPQCSPRSLWPETYFSHGSCVQKRLKNSQQTEFEASEACTTTSTKIDLGKPATLHWTIDYKLYKPGKGELSKSELRICDKSTVHVHH